MSTIKQLIAELKAGKCLAAKDIADLAYALHGAMVDADVPEMLWITTSFEDMGDCMVVAMRNSELEPA